MRHGIMIPMSDNPAKMEIDEEGLIIGVTNRIRTIRYFGNCIARFSILKSILMQCFYCSLNRKHFRKQRCHCNRGSATFNHVNSKW